VFTCAFKGDKGIAGEIIALVPWLVVVALLLGEILVFSRVTPVQLGKVVGIPSSCNRRASRGKRAESDMRTSHKPQASLPMIMSEVYTIPRHTIDPRNNSQMGIEKPIDAFCVKT